MSPAARAGTKVSPHIAGEPQPWLLGDLPSIVRQALLARTTERQFDTGAVVYVAGEKAQALYLIVHGKVRLVRERGGRPVFIHDEGPGGALGEVPLFEGTTYPATAIASEPTRCLVLPRTAILDAIRQHPDLAVAILARLAARVRLLVDRLDRNSTQSTLSRLAELMLSRATAAPGKSFTLGASQQQAAEEIGTVRELVVRGVRTLRERGAVVALGGGRYQLRDAVLLRTIAESE